MLYFLVVWSILAALTWLIGTALLGGLQVTCFDRIGDRAIVALWLGTVVLADGLLFLSLVLPLSLKTGIVIACGVISIISWPPVRAEIQRLRQSLSVSVGLALISWAGLIAAYMSQRVNWFDTGLYHFGLTRWLSEFGAVPGLALLLDNFGFTSAWFAFAAPLTPDALASHTSAITNGFVLLLATYHSLITLWRWLTGNAQIADKFWVVFSGLVLPALTLTTFLSAILMSSSPDIPVIFLSGMVGWSILTIANSPSSHTVSNQTWDAALIPLVLAGGAIAIKLSALPLLPIALLFYWNQRTFNLQRFVVGGTIACLLLIPPMTVSIVTSGCPLYPSSAFCVDVPWRLSASKAQQATEYIRGWNRFAAPPANIPPILWKLWQWLRFARLNVVMFLLLVISVPLVVITLRSAKRKGTAGMLWLSSLGALGMVFILLRAPMIRFGLGYFVMIPAIATAHFSALWFAQLRWRPQWSMLKSSNRSAQALLGIVGVLSVLGILRPDIQSRLLLPPAMPTVEVEFKRSHDVEYVLPIGDRNQCWDAPIPCAPDDDMNIRLRNPERGLAAGFVPGE